MYFGTSKSKYKRPYKNPPQSTVNATMLTTQGLPSLLQSSTLVTYPREKLAIFASGLLAHHMTMSTFKRSPNLQLQAHGPLGGEQAAESHALLVSRAPALLQLQYLLHPSGHDHHLPQALLALPEIQLSSLVVASTKPYKLSQGLPTSTAQ